MTVLRYKQGFCVVQQFYIIKLILVCIASNILIHMSILFAWSLPTVNALVLPVKIC